MIFLNNYIPVRFYYSAELNAYRLEAPLADRPDVVFDEDLIKKLPSSYQMLKTIYVLNPRIFPPVPLGTSMFTVYQNTNYPFETKYIEWVAFPIMANVMTETGNFTFFSFTTSPSKDALPIYVRNEEKRTIISIDKTFISSYFLTTPFYNKSLDRDNFVLYVYESPQLYWRGTTECLCVPSNDPRDFATLVDCQRTMYPKIRNKVSYTGNSGMPLAWMRDKLYPVKPTQTYIYIYIICWLVLFLFLVFVYRHYKIKKHREHLYG